MNNSEKQEVDEADEGTFGLGGTGNEAAFGYATLVGGGVALIVLPLLPWITFPGSSAEALSGQDVGGWVAGVFQAAGPVALWSAVVYNRPVWHGKALSILAGALALAGTIGLLATRTEWVRSAVNEAQAPGGFSGLVFLVAIIATGGLALTAYHSFDLLSHANSDSADQK